MSGKLPKGWETKKLGEVIQLEYGKPLSATLRKPSGKHPVYGANGEKDRTDEYYHDKPSIIVGRKGSAGEINLTESKFWPLDVTYFVTFDRSKYDLIFLYNILLSLELQKLAKGVKPGINRNEVYSIDVTIPPLPEQKRIVAILDEAFSGISRAKEIAEKNLANAKEVFESYLEGVFASVGDGIDSKRLEDCCDLIVDCEHKTAPICDDRSTGYYSIRTPNIGKGVLIYKNANQVTQETYAQWTRRAIPQAGDLIFAREAPAGNVAIIPPGIKVCLGQRTVLLRVNEEKLVPQFLVWLILAPRIQGILLHHSRGATVAHVNMKDICNLPLNELPSLGEQRKIVTKLDSLVMQTKKLESIYDQKITVLDELKKSLLHRAFSGTLTGAVS